MRVLRRWLIVPISAAAIGGCPGVYGQSVPDSTGDKRPGSAFLSPALKAQQDDEGANPGMLWVAEGETLWSKTEGARGQACASCHGPAESSMRGVATRYPIFDIGAGKLLNLEMKINQCRSERQSSSTLAWESRELLGLTAYVAYQSRGLAPRVSIDGAAQPFFEAGRAFFEQRQGQLNLSCGQCHEQNWGRRLRGDTISQGHPTGFPIYRLEWQTMGSLQRRLRACSLGVRAEVLDYGAPEYVALELYLAWRAAGVPIETPGVRR
jgi:L-cysteine S-thiosulfotransferase